MTTDKLRVSLSKLEKYTHEHGGYDLSNHEDGKITLSFVPNFPEATEKGDSTPPRVTLYGKLIQNSTIEFDRVEMEDSTGQRKTRDKEEAELVYGGWLDFIEHNY